MTYKIISKVGTAYASILSWLLLCASHDEWFACSLKIYLSAYFVRMLFIKIMNKRYFIEYHYKRLGRIRICKKAR